MTTNENTPVVETKVVEEPVVETPVAEPEAETVVAEPEVATEGEPEAEPAVICEKCGKPVSECECPAEPAYVLEEIAEYVELQQKYAELETQFNELTSAHNALKAENETLVSFKLNVEKKEKEAMIASFYMLSEEDKKDVINNIDTYSLDDIEAKLSILCVRNKVSFDLEDNKETDVDPMAYSLNSATTDDNLPE